MEAEISQASLSKMHCHALDDNLLPDKDATAINNSPTQHICIIRRVGCDICKRLADINVGGGVDVG